MYDNPLCLLVLFLIPGLAGVMAAAEWYIPASWKEQIIRVAFGCHQKVSCSKGGKTIDVSKRTVTGRTLSKMRPADSIYQK
ncbi:MAG: hypothetical protein HFG27_08425 [Provencibacterium sp.]|jgi:hypothetical protein|nr:hypothetical protein [Provencibacterium sp.]